MKDPFALLPPAPEYATGEKKSPGPKKMYWVIAIMAAFILILGFGLFLNLRSRVGADANITNASAQVALTGAPTEIKPGDQVSLTLSITNQSTQKITGAFALVEGTAVDLSQTITLVKNLQQTDPGYLRKIGTQEISYFSNPGDSGFYWYIGDLGGKQTKSQQVKATIGGTSEGRAIVEAKLMQPKDISYSCGTFGLSRCQQTSGALEVADQSLDLNLISLASIKLRAGYNFITLPYAFTVPAAKSFLGELKNQWAYVYQPSSGAYLDLNKDENAGMIKPGVGFWLYDSSGGEYSLPKDKAATSIEESYTEPLDIGFNQIGNPYLQRMILSGDKIMVRELADDGSATGTIYSLKSAIDSGVLSSVYVVSYNYQSDPSGEKDLSKLMTYKTIPLESVIQPYTGMTIKSTKKVNIIFPGRDIIAPGDLISAAEKKQIDLWISQNGLNQYGDVTGTAYSGGTPLISTTNGQVLDRYDYILVKHPDRPWRAVSST